MVITMIFGLHSTVTKIIFVVGMVGGGLYMLFSRKEKKVAMNKHAQWTKRLHQLVDHFDVDDDGHLIEWLNPETWEKVFADLEKTPKGSRSLKKAMSSVAPEVFE